MQTQIIARENEKGVIFPDGTIMLSRQGCSQTLNCNANGAFMEVHFGDRARFTLFYESKGSRAQHSRDGAIQLSRTEHYLDERFIEGALGFVEQHTGARPTAIRKETHAYMYGMGGYAYEKADIILSPFRYSSEHQAVVFTSGKVIAKPSENFIIEAKQFTTTGILDQSDDEQISLALSRALKDGFHACDTKLGFDHCMRRLAWLTGTYYLAARAGQVVDVHVLKSDMESPASISET